MMYLDHSATSPVIEEVFQSYEAVTTQFFANPSSLHTLGVETNQLLQRATSQIEQLLQLKQGRVIYTSGGTEANNLALFGYARQHMSEGKHIVTSQVEHPSILETCRQLEREGFEVTYVPVNAEGIVDVEALQQSLRSDTILVSMMHVNNEMGAIQPIEQIASIVAAHSSAVFHVDAVQSYGKLNVPVGATGADMISISAHKLGGMRGSGALIMRHAYPLQPIVFGGGQQFGVRSGTIAVAEAVALAKAMRLAHRTEEHPQYRTWKQQIVETVETLPTMRLLGSANGAAHITAIAMKHIRGEVAVNFLQQRNIIVSTSSACSSLTGGASHVVEALKLPPEWQQGVIRISFGHSTTAEEVEACVSALRQLHEQIK